MNTILIICIVIAALVGATITYFFLLKKAKSEHVIHDSFQEVSFLKQENDKLKKLRLENEQTICSLNLKITQLDRELFQAPYTNADDVVKAKLVELDTIRQTVSALEYQLEEKDNTASEIEKKFKKKIGDLEDELDDKEDEFDDLEKKSKRIQNDLQQQVEEALQKQKRTAVELEEASQKLTQFKSEVERQKQSLAFIQEVLSAKPISDASVAGLEKRVDQVANYIRGELRDCLIQAFDFSKEQEEDLFGAPLETWTVTKKKTWIQGKITIAFVGEFSAGKTSIVNRLLSGDNPDVPKLPTSMKATTAIPTYISGGIKTIYSFVTPNNIQKEISENTFKRVNKEVLDNIPGVSSLIQYFVMTYKNPVLDKLSILDTPGFSSNDSEDTMRTIDVINECDALFWVFDVNVGTVNRKSIDIIRRNLHKPLYIVINQIDTKAKTEVDKVEKLITDTLHNSGVKVEGVIRFSIKEPLSVMTNVIKKIPCDISKEDYIGNVVNDLNEAISLIKSMMDEKNRERLDFRKQGEEIDNQFISILNSLSDNSEEAASIPQYNSRFFSADDYRMSEEEYSKLTELLNSNEELCNNAAYSYDSKVENTSELVTAYESFSECKDIYNRVNKCKSNLDKFIKNL